MTPSRLTDAAITAIVRARIRSHGRRVPAADVALVVELTRNLLEARDTRQAPPPEDAPHLLALTAAAFGATVDVITGPRTDAAAATARQAAYRVLVLEGASLAVTGEVCGGRRKSVVHKGIRASEARERVDAAYARTWRGLVAAVTGDELAARRAVAG